MTLTTLSRIFPLALALTGCVGTLTEGEDPADTGDEPMYGAQTTASGEPAARYNANPFKPTNGAEAYECIAPRGGANATVTAHFFDGSPAFFGWRAVDFTGTTCQPGELRIARWEKLSVGGQPAYIMRGGGGTNAAEAFGNTGIRFGHVLASDLAKGTSVVTADIPGSVGKAPASCTGALYTSDPARGTTADLSSLYYKPNQAASSGAKWDNYGDQAGTGPTHYTTLLWTWPVQPDGSDNAGGGQIRAVIAEGEPIRACDVAPVYLPMYRASSSSSAGRVKMEYGRVRNGDGVAYGWFAVAWQLSGGSWHYFVDADS